MSDAERLRSEQGRRAQHGGLGGTHRQGHTLSPALSLENLSFAYEEGAHGTPWILRHIDLQIEPGEFICLLGPSGCGKSTLLQLIAGFLRATEGQIRIGEAPVLRPGSDRAVVTQHPSLYPWLTVLENVCLPLEVRGVPRSRREHEGMELLNLFGIETAATMLPHQLSGGMQQRVMVARALIQKPALLLMDEPFSALDGFTRERLQLELLRVWQRTRITVFMITHDVEEATLLSTRALVMGSDPGRIVAEAHHAFGRSMAEGELSASTVRTSPGFLEARERLRHLALGS